MSDGKGSDNDFNQSYWYPYSFCYAFDKEIETYKQMTERADDTYEVVRFTETDGGSRMMTMKVKHP